MTLSVLISGGGVAGPCLAYWLDRAGYACTIVERSPVPRTTGQQIDIRGAAFQIIKWMGLEDAVRERTVKEEGLAFVDNAGKWRAKFPARDDGSSFTSQIEILRGDLAQVLFEATKEKVNTIWGDYITGLSEQDDGVLVKFVKSKEEKFDLVILADGMNSRTRSLVFEDDNILKPLGQHMAFFTIPVAEHDTRWATWYNAPGGRTIMIRPDLERNRTGAYFAVCNSDAPQNHLQLSTEDQKHIWKDLFKDAGGESERLINGMYEADDFYMQEIAQVIMPQWTKGRIALLGDCAYCPSPITGLGTSCALIGAYMLAGELKQHDGDYKAAFTSFEEKLQPVIKRVQKLPPGAPQLANPQTSWGITIFYGILSAISWSGLANWFQGGVASGIADIPDYKF